jgi:hypothetical protein
MFGKCRYATDMPSRNTPKPAEKLTLTRVVKRAAGDFHAVARNFDQLQ